MKVGDKVRVVKNIYIHPVRFINVEMEVMLIHDNKKLVSVVDPEKLGHWVCLEIRDLEVVSK